MWVVAPVFTRQATRRDPRRVVPGTWVRLSDGSISNLCDRFLVYFEALHLARLPELRRAMQDGYPLHLDATCEHGKGGLFVCMDGWRGWVLMATRIPSEHEDYLRPLVEKTAALFGDPITTVMGEGVAKAVAPLRHGKFPILSAEPLSAAFREAVSSISGANTKYRAICGSCSGNCAGIGSQHLLSRLGPGVHEDLGWCAGRRGKEGPVKAASHIPATLPTGFAQSECWVPSPRTPATRRAIAHLTRLLIALNATNGGPIGKGLAGPVSYAMSCLTNAELPWRFPPSSGAPRIWK